MEIRCSICGRKLKTRVSRQRNIGPYCEKKHVYKLNEGQLVISEFENIKTNNLFKYEIKEISKNEALEMIRKYHYSNTLPKINKHFIGFFLNSELVGVVTLG